MRELIQDLLGSGDWDVRALCTRVRPQFNASLRDVQNELKAMRSEGLVTVTGRTIKSNS